MPFAARRYSWRFAISPSVHLPTRYGRPRPPPRDELQALHGTAGPHPDRREQTVAIYARYSDETQMTIEDQIALCRAYAAERGWTVTHIYSDAASPRIANRPQFIEMMASANSKPLTSS